MRLVFLLETIRMNAFIEYFAHIVQTRRNIGELLTTEESCRFKWHFPRGLRCVGLINTLVLLCESGKPIDFA